MVKEGRASQMVKEPTETQYLVTYRLITTLYDFVKGMITCLFSIFLICIMQKLEEMSKTCSYKKNIESFLDTYLFLFSSSAISCLCCLFASMVKEISDAPLC